MITFRPATRKAAPLTIGLAGPSKSGKSLSALRLAVGLAGGGEILLVNTEPHGDQYADTFHYRSADLTEPHRPQKYVEALKTAQEHHPAVVIMDSFTHVWDGIGGMLEWRDELALEFAKGDASKADRHTARAWAKIRAEENHLVYQLLSMDAHVILTFRAKDKIKIVKRTGEWVDQGLKPIASERIAFETMFTLTLPAYARGVPDLDISELRTPFDTMIPKNKPLDEALGQRLAAWAKGSTTASRVDAAAPKSQRDLDPGATSGGGTGGVPKFETPHRPEDVEGWISALDTDATTPEMRLAIWTALTVGKAATWQRMGPANQKRLLDANTRAKLRLGERP